MQRQSFKVRAAPNTRTLDDRGLAFARLLVDPCNAPLVGPVYPGGDAGFLFRAESFFTLGTAALETSGIVHWTPGYVNSTNTELLSGTSAGGGATTTMTGRTDNPGKTFLATNARGVRCVAACMKVTYPGAESARAGRVHFGSTQASSVDSGNVITPDSVAQLLQNYSRTPADTIELVWKPNIADTEFNDPAESAGPVIRDRKSALTVAWAGLPASVGLTFHLTAVYEWTPALGLGVGHNTNGKVQSRNSLDDVLDYVIQRGFKWARSAAMEAGNHVIPALAATVSNTFGIMPANMRTRRMPLLTN